MRTAFLKGIELSSEQSILTSSAVNVQESLSINSFRQQQHTQCALVLASEERLHSRCFIYCFERGSVFQGNLFYFQMKVSISFV